MKNAEYWANRMRILDDALLDTGYSYIQNLEKQYNIAIADLDKKIAAWYQRFAVNNEIDLATAKKWLNSSELEEFRWTVEQYIKRGEVNGISADWRKQLENASARVHISRLESLQLELRQEAEALHSTQLKHTETLLGDIYREGYYHTAFEVQKGLGLGWSMQSLDTDTIYKVLSRPWTTDGQTFRDRCWTNKSALVNSVNTQLTQMIIRGEAPDKAIKAISHQFEVSKSKAGRLIMTESAAFSAAAQKDCFNELGVEQYTIVETFDNETCPLCGALDGKVFKMSDYAVGSTAPPFHPWCRGCTAPYFEDMKNWKRSRAAKGEDEKTYTVPGNMTYSDWKQEYIVKPEEMRYNILKDKAIAQRADYSTALNTGAQNKHIEGSAGYDPSRGTLTADPQALYDMYAGKGRYLATRGNEWNNKERFEHTDIIGTYRSTKGIDLPTKRGIIHYSKRKGWHIVPARPGRKGSTI